MNANSENLFSIVADWNQQGHNYALAIVISTWGSSPRQAGSIMAIREDGRIEGSVSGGCVEAAVIETAFELMKEGGTERLDFGVADETAWQVGLSCGGEISVWICPKSSQDDAVLSTIIDAIKARQPIYIGCFINQEKMHIAAPHPPNQFSDDGNIFYLTITPPPQLFIVGAVHISQFLAPMAASTGYQVTVIDPRAIFAHPERFPEIELVHAWPQDIFPKLKIDSQTAIVTLTHDPKIDDAALHHVLPATPFYIACLGSRKTHDARCKRLLAAGFSPSQIAQISGPAGFDIGAETPSEIAVSVLSEMIAAFRKGME